MTEAVELVAMPEQAIAYLAVHGSVRKMKEPFARLFAALAEAGLAAAGPPMARFDPDLTDFENADYEVCVPVEPDAEGRVPDAIGEARCDILPAHYALVTTHRGPHASLGASFEALAAEVSAVGYAVAGPATEVYLAGPESGITPAEYVTEVRLPIAR